MLYKTDDFTVSPIGINKAVKDFKKGKSAALDNLRSLWWPNAAITTTDAKSTATGNCTSPTASVSHHCLK